MPIPIFAKFDGIEGSCKINDDNRVGQIEILEFYYNSYIPLREGSITGVRVHKPITFVKEIDKASPLLADAVWHGKIIDTVDISWYRITKTGREEKYFVISLEKVRIVGITPYMPMILDRTNEMYNHLEKVELRFEKIRVEWLDGGLAAVDSYEEDKQYG